MLRELGVGPDRATEFLVPRQRAWLLPWLCSVLQEPVAQLACPTLSWHMDQWNTQHSLGSSKEEMCWYHCPSSILSSQSSDLLG